ncbi:hypothetical protein HGRIS_002421 [Hohenbuehelia grisea]|uniref:Uncharacterized protein n=1 Tax=Hohenbuehelia grisea TaxID=104357 RepID=A0ABR3JLC8_9AGAR
MYFLPYILNILVIHSGLQIPCVWLTPPLLIGTFASELEDAKAEKEAAKKRCQVDRDQARVDNELRDAAREAAWKQAQDDHAAAVVEWEETCAELRSQGTRVKDLPKKPARVLKKDVLAAFDDAINNGSDNESAESDAD